MINIIGAVVAGIAGTIVMTLVMVAAPKMGMPKMDIVGVLGSMFKKEGNRPLGLAMHFMMGIVFAVIYALLWSKGIGRATIGYGAIFGVVHWLIFGLVMGMIPMLHAGIKAGTVKAPGVYMTNNRQDFYYFIAVIDTVDHSIVPDSYSVVICFYELFITKRPGIILQ